MSENLHIVNLSSYNRPEIKEDKKHDFIKYGEDNDYYNYLIDLYINSTTNHAIINGVANMIYGKGVDALDSAQKPDQYAILKSIFNDECLRKITLDLKLLGEASFQVLYQGGKVVKAEHFPRQTLRAEKMDKEGDIKAYYYSPDWTKVKQHDDLKKITAFGYGNKIEPEIKIIKKYVSGYDYYCPPDYQGGTAYAEMESEISDYLINDIQCGFSGTKVVNFNNGVPDREKQLQVKNDVLNKLAGSLGEKIIIAFNNNAESKTTVDDLPLNDAPSHYEYLARECANKLIVAHRVTSPLLLGIRTENQGLGSNADEIKTAALLFDNVTIKPYQHLITSAMDDILAVNNIALKLYFKTLQPLEFTETDNAITNEAREEETGVKLSDEELALVGKPLIDLGEDEDLQNWQLIDKVKVDYDDEERLDKMIGLANTGSAKSNAKSSQDGEVEKGDEVMKFKVRYKYMPERFDDETREFCRLMVQAGKIYRKEDIMSMKDKKVNPGWGPRGADTYDIWLYKGGGSCRHYWERRTYMSVDVQPDVKNPNSEISVNEAKRAGFTPETNDSKVAKRTRDQKNRGFLKPKNFKTPKSKGV